MACTARPEPLSVEPWIAPSEFTRVVWSSPFSLAKFALDSCLLPDNSEDAGGRIQCADYGNMRSGDESLIEEMVPRPTSAANIVAAIRIRDFHYLIVEQSFRGIDRQRAIEVVHNIVLSRFEYPHF